jgi:hypothetical protein
MPDSRPRSAAVTAAATLALLVCGSAFFFWGYLFLSVLNAAPSDKRSHFYQANPLLFFAIALIPFGVIALGIRTGIGLFQLRPWARVAALIWASITLVFCLTLIAVRPFETFFIADNFVSATESFNQLVAIALLILLLPSSVWWLFLFRGKNVKKQFQAVGAEDAGKNTLVTDKV